MSTQGLALDEHFDLIFDSSGDAAFSVGIDEIQKDVAFIIANTIDESSIGDLIRPNDALQLETEIEQKVASHNLIDSVVTVSVSQDQRADTLRCNVQAIASFDGINRTVTVEQAIDN